MQASYCPHQSNSPLKFLFFLALIGVAFLAIYVAFTVDTASGHGLLRHGSGAVAVRECLSKNGSLQDWVNPDTGRRARICQIGPELFGIQIVEQDQGGLWHEITAFVKNRMTRIDQVMQYLRNTGYTPIQ